MNKRDSIEPKINSGNEFDQIRLRTTQAPDELVTAEQSGDICSEEGAKTAEDGSDFEKTMPCGMRYPEPFRTRPNFFIPLVSVGSYVLPFVFLILLNAVFRIIPGIPEFRQELYDLDQGWHMSDQAFALGVLVLLSVPMGIGAITAAMLKKLEKMRTKTRLITWFAIVFSVCVIECLFVALIRYAWHDTFGLR